LRLHAIRAFEGDCLLLETDGTPARYVLVDGGPAGTFGEHASNYLAAVMPRHRPLDAIVVSHVDRDHVVGILDLLADVRRREVDGEEAALKPSELWYNSFGDAIDDDGTIATGMRQILANAVAASTAMTDCAAAVLGIAEGEQLRRTALILGIPINRTVGGALVSADAGCGRVVELAGLRTTIVGPTGRNLERLRQEWREWVGRNRLAARPDKLANADSSVPNLSSIVMLVEDARGSALLTGDARGDHIEEGLDQAGLRPDGVLHVDLMKVQHHGSGRNATRGFFRRNTADSYVVSTNGRHGHPAIETLTWIVEEAQAAGRRIEIVATYDTASLQELRRRHPPETSGYAIRLPGAGDDGVAIEVGRPTDPGSARRVDTD
jgi:beta-lactamase superfamily II metal-dependent hydrolase